MKIAKNLSLVLPLYDEENKIYAYVQSYPVTAQFFETHFRVLLKTFQLMSEGNDNALSMATTISRASLFLKDAARSLARRDEEASDIYGPVLNEITRLSTVALSGKDGWDNIPLVQAIEQSKLETEDADAAISAAVFFTVASRASPKHVRAGYLAIGMSMWGAQTTSLPLTEWIASLPTLKETDNTGETPPATTISIVGAG